MTPHQLMSSHVNAMVDPALLLQKGGLDSMLVLPAVNLSTFTII